MDVLKTIARHENFTIDSKATIKDALGVMHENKNGCAILIHQKLPIAILTESDVVQALKQRIDLDSQAFDIATKNLVSTHENRPVEFAFDILSEHNIRRVILVDGNGNYTGVVLQEDLFDYLEEDVYKVDLRISDIIKPHSNVITVQVDDSVNDALDLMQEHEIGSVVVCDLLGDFVGIITEKDILKLTYYSVNMNDNIQEHMTKPVISVKLDALVTDVIDVMKLKSIRRVIVTDEHGKLITILTNRDILKHIKGNYTRILQMKIRHAQEIMDFIPEPIIEIIDHDEQQIINWMNLKAKDIFGRGTLDHVTTKLFSKEDWEAIYAHFSQTQSLTNMVVQINKATYEISGTVSKNLNSRYIKLIFKDVTLHELEKSKLQVAIDEEIKKRLDNEYLLMQQSKLATMGEMIAHIAHQWRQPLAQLGGIFMNLDAAYAFNELKPDYFNDRIHHGNELLKYMSTTIDDFRNFYEPNRQKEKFNLCEYIQSAINIIHASYTYHHINLTFNHPEEPIFLSGYPSEFAQVILNLLVNAQDIFAEKKVNTPKVSIDVTLDKKVVSIVVADNAGGILPTILPRVFDMYFTTKKQKQGTGLGLYMSKLIIETKLEGSISVSNTPEGASFKIILKV